MTRFVAAAFIALLFSVSIGGCRRVDSGSEPKPATTTPVPQNSERKTNPSVPSPASPAAKSAPSEPWRRITQFDFAALPMNLMPPDDGYVSAIASADETPGGPNVQHLARIEQSLKTWSPGHVPDLVQRVRNHLLLLGVADVAQSPLERFLPAVVVRRLLEDIPSDQLAQLMCWVALHSNEGEASVMTDPLLVELGAPNVNPQEVRNRTFFYGAKITRRLIGW